MINDYELKNAIEKVEKLREDVKNDSKAMKLYEHLKELNNNDLLYGWMFVNNDILEEDLIDFSESYQKPYVLAVLQVYANELENIMLRSDL